MHTLVRQAPILVVEDDDDIRDVLSILLEEAGYCVLAAANGREALDVMESGSDIGVIILDLDMPVMGGRRFLHVRREQSAKADVPVIIFASSPRDMTDAGIQGVVAWVQKPGEFSDLLDAIALSLRQV